MTDSLHPAAKAKAHFAEAKKLLRETMKPLHLDEVPEYLARAIERLKAIPKRGKVKR